MEKEMFKKILRPTKRKLLGTAAIFVVLAITTSAANIFFSFRQGIGAPLPFYVVSICSGQGCPEVNNGLRPVALALNFAICYLISVSGMKIKGEIK